MRPHYAEPNPETVVRLDGTRPSLLDLKPYGVRASCDSCGALVVCANYMISPWTHGPECRWCRESFEAFDAPPVVVNAKTDPIFVHEECIGAYLLALKGVSS